MALGIHFALDAQTEARLLAAVGDDAALIRLVEEIERTWPHRLSCHHERAWDPVHRCLGNGSLDDRGEYPLSAAVLGGRRLLVGEHDYTVSYVDVDQVREVSAALAKVDEQWLRQRYATLEKTDYYGPIDDEDLDETLADFADTREFFAKAATAGHAVIFTVDT